MPSRLALRPSTGLLIALALLSLLGLAVPLAPAASAHAQVVTLEPTDGATLTTAPARIAITLSEKPLPDAVRIALTGPSGAVPLTQSASDKTAIGIPAATLAPGAYKLAWRIASVDGHVVSGTSDFTISGAASTSATAASPQPSESSPAVIAPAPSSATASATNSATSAVTTTDDGSGDARSPLPFLAIGVALIAGAAVIGARYKNSR